MTNANVCFTSNLNADICLFWDFSPLMIARSARNNSSYPFRLLLDPGRGVAVLVQAYDER